jgi:hypothetical protein
LDFGDATDEMDMLEIMMDDELNAEREEDVFMTRWTTVLEASFSLTRIWKLNSLLLRKT